MTGMTILQNVKLYDHGRIAMVELDAPERRNAMGPGVVAGLRQATAILAGRRGEPDAARAVVLTGAGGVFCSGGDLAAANDIIQARGRGETVSAAGFTLDEVHAAFMGLRKLDCPLICAVNGPAIGIGLSVALAGDMIVAARSAYFSARFVRMAMGAENGVSWRLPRVVGELRAREMLLLGEKVDAETALAWGLANRVFDDEGFRQAALTFAGQVAEAGPLALAAVRRLSDSAWTNDYDSQVRAEHAAGAVLGRSGDASRSARRASRDTRCWSWTDCGPRPGSRRRRRSPRRPSRSTSSARQGRRYAARWPRPAPGPRRGGSGRRR
jgi:2-(1,2-epoxy-1,2-dihydrophenyl)acetyl-CoA isomerase